MFGYGKVIYFWLFIVVIILFSLGGMFFLYEGWYKLGYLELLSFLFIVIGVLVFVIVVEGIFMWGCLWEVNKVCRGCSYWCWFRESC